MASSPATPCQSLPLPISARSDRSHDPLRASSYNAEFCILTSNLDWRGDITVNGEKLVRPVQLKLSGPAVRLGWPFPALPRRKTAVVRMSGIGAMQPQRNYSGPSEVAPLRPCSMLSANDRCCGLQPFA